MQREELLRLVENSPKRRSRRCSMMSAVTCGRSGSGRGLLPGFRAGEGSADDVAARSEDLLMDGLGHSA